MIRRSEHSEEEINAHFKEMKRKVGEPLESLNKTQTFLGKMVEILSPKKWQLRITNLGLSNPHVKLFAYLFNIGRK